MIGSYVAILLIIICLFLMFTLKLNKESISWKQLYSYNKQVFTYVLTSTKPSVRVAVIILLAIAGLGIALSLIGIVLTFLS